MVRSPHLLTAKVTEAVVTKAETSLEFMVSLKTFSRLIAIS